MELNVIAAAVLFGLFQGVMILLVFAKRKRIETHKMLIFFITCLILTQLHSFMVRSGLMMHATWLLNTNVPLIFLFGPLVWFYTINTINRSVSIIATVVHLLPFILYFGYSFFFFLQPVAYKQYVITSMLGLPLSPQTIIKPFASDPLNIQGWIVVEMLSLHLVVYAAASLWKLKRFKQSNKSSSVINWVTFLNLVMLTGGFVLFFSEGGVINGKVFFKTPIPPYASDLFGTAAMYATSLYLIQKPAFLSQSGVKYKNSKIPQEVVESKVAKLKSLIEKDKLYLRPDFSIDLLSTTSGISKHHISQLINDGMRMSFFEMTNTYRIEEAKRILAGNNYVKMETLAMDMGYRSKSSFFAAFKRITHMTPAKYLAQMT